MKQGSISLVLERQDVNLIAMSIFTRVMNLEDSLRIYRDASQMFPDDEKFQGLVVETENEIATLRALSVKVQG